jgi:hypothetical protein
MRCQWIFLYVNEEIMPWTVESLPSPVGSPGAIGATGGEKPSSFTAGGVIMSRLTAGGERPSRLERFWRGVLVPNRIRAKRENKAEKYMASLS